jgi:hypothetical protein
MKEETIMFFFVKFGQYQFMKELYDSGQIFMQRWRTFRNIEHDQIGDRNEGLSHAIQASNIIAEFNGKKAEGEPIGPLRCTFNPSYNPMIFCLYCFTDRNFNESGSQIDPRCCGFGEYAVVITNIEKFNEMLLDALESSSRGNVHSQLIDYVPYYNYQGEMGPFRKYDDFKYQSEYRFVYESEDTAPTHTLQIGSLKEVAILCPSEQVHQLVKHIKVLK